MTTYLRMTHAAARKVEDKARAAASAIPEAHNRKRAEAYERVWREAIGWRSPLKTISHADAIGRDAIYYYTVNEGSRRFPYYVFKTMRTTVKEAERRTNLIVLYR